MSFREIKREKAGKKLQEVGVGTRLRNEPFWSSGWSSRRRKWSSRELGLREGKSIKEGKMILNESMTNGN